MQVSEEMAGAVFAAMGLDYSSGTKVPPVFSKKPPGEGWQALLFDVESQVPIFHLKTKEKSFAKLRTFLSGVKANHCVIIATLADHDVLVIRNYRHDDKAPYVAFPMREQARYDKAISVLRKYRITDDILIASMALGNIIKDLDASSSAFINRGLFSTYYLEERLFKEMSKEERNLGKEAKDVLGSVNIADPRERVRSMLISLGYDLLETPNGYALKVAGKKVSSITITDQEEMYIKKKGVIPSVQAVAELKNYDWVMLTNGRLWRMYSSKVSSSTTNYFEIDVDQISDEKDLRLQYLVAIFGALSMASKAAEMSHLDKVHEGGENYASELEKDMRIKVFDGVMFTMLVRGVLDHTGRKRHTEEELENAKELAIRLLYRLLFILYAESRMLLPVDHAGYKKVSMLSMRDKLESFEKEEDKESCWENVKLLFRGINKGDARLNLPQYNGKLFEEGEVDGLVMRNRFLVPAIRGMMEMNGKGIDYQNLGVRHLGSIYEGLLDYDVLQAENDIFVGHDGKIYSAKFLSDLKPSEKPRAYVSKNDIYLAKGGMARKGTGSYFTPEPIVKHLVKSGLKPIFEQREKDFAKAIGQNTKESKKKCNDLMLDLQVLDPAMGSGHFLVAAVDEITHWIIRLIEKYPHAPITEEIELQRQRVIDTQEKKGIKLNTDLLTANAILKRMVMKRCIYGTDINGLSVELAKLSLWLDSFTIGMPLTVLRHHIRRGNALIGIYDPPKKIKNGSLDDYVDPKVMKKAGEILDQISHIPDIDLEEVGGQQDKLEKFQKAIKEEKNRLNGRCVNMMYGKDFKKENESKTTKKHAIFHWKLEFPDAFTDLRPGFDLIVGNPPWEIIQLNDDEFFAKYYEGFRTITNKQEKIIIQKKILNDPNIKLRYELYKQNIKLQSNFYIKSDQYPLRGTGKSDLWQIFLERTISLLSKDGIVSILIPASLRINEGAIELRKQILQSKIISLYEFENKGIFPDIDDRYKFILLTMQNVTSQQSFDVAFYLHNLQSLERRTEDAKFMKLSQKALNIISGKDVLIPEIREHKALKILEKLYNNNKRIINGLDNNTMLKFVTEFNRADKHKLFQSKKNGWPLIEGKNFHQYIHNWTKSEFNVIPKEGLKKLDSKKEYDIKNEQIHNSYRLAFRDISAPTNMRTMISCILPPHTFFSDKAPLLLLKQNNNVILDKKYEKKMIYICAIFNSMAFDFIIRHFINSSVSFFILNNIVIPNDTTTNISKLIIKIATKLIIQDNKFAKLGKSLNHIPKKLSLLENIQTRAHLDALIAYNYGLTKDEYEYIINTFKFEGDINFQEEIKWNNATVYSMNNEVRKIAMQEYDKIVKEFTK